MSNSAAENSTKTAKRAPRGRSFKPGVSGNPGGRPKLFVNVRDLAREQTERAVQTLIDALASVDERVRVSAANALLDRGWGKPTAEVNLTTSASEAREYDLTALSDAELEQWHALAARAKMGDVRQP